MEGFTKEFDVKYMVRLETEVDDSDAFRGLMDTHISRLRKCVTEMKTALDHSSDFENSPSELGAELGTRMEAFIDSAEEHWIRRTRDSFAKYNAAMENVSFFRLHS